MLPYALTIFLSAFLLFLVQPLIAKQILPWFGGAASVWTTCLLFFQSALLAGYAYADASVRWLRPRQQVYVHAALMLLSLGARLSSSQVRDASAGLRGAVLAAAVRLVACFAILWLLPLSGLERGAFILYACLPSAMFNFMLADKFNVAPNRVASIVIMGHVASLALLPLGLWLAL